MTGAPEARWPEAGLDPVRRLRVVAGTAAHPVYAERYVDAPVAAVWRVAADLEHELPLLVRGVRSFTPSDAGRAGAERFSATAVSTLRHRERFDVVLRPGWCLMQSRLLLGGMAAVPEGAGTRFALLYALRVPGGSAVPLLRLLGGRSRSSAVLDRLAARVAAGGA